MRNKLGYSITLLGSVYAYILVGEIKIKPWDSIKWLDVFTEGGTALKSAKQGKHIQLSASTSVVGIQEEASTLIKIVNINLSLVKKTFNFSSYLIEYENAN